MSDTILGSLSCINMKIGLKSGSVLRFCALAIKVTIIINIVYGPINSKDTFLPVKCIVQH